MCGGYYKFWDMPDRIPCAAFDYRTTDTDRQYVVDITSYSAVTAKVDPLPYISSILFSLCPNFDLKYNKN
jgi:hypothetical protein